MYTHSVSNSETANYVRIILGDSTGKHALISQQHKITLVVLLLQVDPIAPDFA